MKKTVRQALGIVKDFHVIELSAGKNPMSLAATVPYSLYHVMWHENMTQENIANTAWVTGVTLKQVEWYKEKQLELDNTLTNPNPNQMLLKL